MMYGREKSDSAIVAMKPANNAGHPAAEQVERRAGTEGNAGQQSTRRAQNRESVSQALGRVRQAAKRSPCRQTPEVGAGCGKPARPDLCGGRPETDVPTANGDSPFPIRVAVDASHGRGPSHIGGKDRGKATGLGHSVSPIARRRPDRNSSRSSGLRYCRSLGTTRGVMARSFATISPASSSRPIWA